jgi:predicted ATP-grasp superfamily ATP-dependent carboligase
MAELEFQDNHPIPGMADKAQTFLQVIKERTDQSGIDLQFHYQERRVTIQVLGCQVW